MNRSKQSGGQGSSPFKDEMDRIGVVRTGSDDKVSLKPPPPAPPAESLDEPDNRRVLKESMLLNPDDSEHEIEENENLRKDSLSLRDFRALRQGKIAVQDHIDLHGHTVAEARTMILDFINESRSRNKRCIRIVHGKGRQSPDGIPKLKILTHNLLRQHNGILGYCKARPVDGGSGASVVLLRRK